MVALRYRYRDQPSNIRSDSSCSRLGVELKRGFRKWIPFRIEDLLRFLHQHVQIAGAQRWCFINVIGWARLELEPQLFGFLAERRTGQDGQVEYLSRGEELARCQVLKAATHRSDCVTRQADNQIDFDFDASVHQRAYAALERLQIILAIHQRLSLGIDRLQPDFDFVKLAAFSSWAVSGRIPSARSSPK